MDIAGVVESDVAAAAAAAAAVYAGWLFPDGASAVHDSRCHQTHSAGHRSVHDSLFAGDVDQSRYQDLSNQVHFGGLDGVAVGVEAGCDQHVVVAAEYAVGYSGSLSAADGG